MTKKIGIIEVCQPTHYSVVNGLLKAYACDKNNIVYVFVLQKIADALRQNGMPENARLFIYSEKDDLGAFIKNIEIYQFDRFHLCTVSKHFPKFLRFTPQCKQLYFHVHNVEEWYGARLSQGFNLMMHDLKSSTVKVSPVRAVYRFVKGQILNRYRQAILKKVYSYNHHFIVHSHGVRQFLSRYVPENKITVFPFAIYEYMPDNSKNNSRLRICVPGVVTNMRRDYNSLFNILQSNAEKLKGKLTVDLLGYIPQEELHLLDTIKSLQAKGIDMIYYLEFVFGEKYDQPLSQADIVLGNLRVDKNSVQKYGQTKESGTVYNMVRGAKPGLLPKVYPVDEEFHNSSIFFEDYDDLGEIILHLVSDPGKIDSLKRQAKITSEQFSPESLYQLLMAEKVMA
jgi:hypothetical protein